MQREIPDVPERCPVCLSDDVALVTTRTGNDSDPYDYHGHCYECRLDWNPEDVGD